MDESAEISGPATFALSPDQEFYPFGFGRRGGAVLNGDRVGSVGDREGVRFERTEGGEQGMDRAREE